MLALQPPEHRVALAGREPPGRRAVEGQDAAHLADDSAGVRPGADGRGDGPAGPLYQVDAGVVAHVVGNERQAHLVGAGLGLPGRRPEAEGRRRAERERRVRVKLRCNRHVTHIAPRSDIPRDSGASEPS
jgi:hypothetical protein